MIVVLIQIISLVYFLTEGEYKDLIIIITQEKALNYFMYIWILYPMLQNLVVKKSKDVQRMMREGPQASLVTFYQTGYEITSPRKLDTFALCHFSSELNAHAIFKNKIIITAITRTASGDTILYCLPGPSHPFLCGFFN